MKDIKLKEGLENSYAAFFDDEKHSGDMALDFSNDQLIFQENEKHSASKISIWKVFKQLFFFLPGTFATFFLWMELMAVRNIPYYSLLFWLILLLSPFLIVVGIGEFKKLKNWLIPLNVIILGAFLGLVLSNIPALKNLLAGNGNVLILLPLALVTAVLTKSWVDQNEQQKL